MECEREGGNVAEMERVYKRGGREGVMDERERERGKAIEREIEEEREGEREYEDGTEENDREIKKK